MSVLLSMCRTISLRLYRHSRYDNRPERATVARLLPLYNNYFRSITVSTNHKTNWIDIQKELAQTKHYIEKATAMVVVAHNNAFGPGAVSWNIGFPDGNITAPEMIAYVPHNLKGIDWVDRLISHGAKASHIAAMINEFRILPDDRIHMPNSTLIMISYAMRRAGKPGWTISTHAKKWATKVWRDDDLSVAAFRTPRETHPKTMKGTAPEHLAHNQKAEPVQFKDLARGVKKHPSGGDALDLTRCVLYAVEHPDEDWKYPDDFKRLVNHLGGPAQVTRAHYDRQAFARRNHVKFSAPSSKTTKRKQESESQATGSHTTTVSKKCKTSDKLGNTMANSESTRRSSRLTKKSVKFIEESDMNKKEKKLSKPEVKKSKLSKGRYIAKSEPIEANDSTFAEDECKMEHEEPSEAEIRCRSNARRTRAANTPTEDGNEDHYSNAHFGYKPEYSSDTRPRQNIPRSRYKDGSGQLAYKTSDPYGLGADHNSNQCGYGLTQSAHQENFRSSLGASSYNFGSHNGAQQFSSGASLDKIQFGPRVCLSDNQFCYEPSQSDHQTGFSSLGTQLSASVVDNNNTQFSYVPKNAMSKIPAGCSNDANLDELQDQDASELFGLQPFQSSQRSNVDPIQGPRQSNFAPFQARYQPSLANAAHILGPPRPYPAYEETTHLTKEDFEAVKRYQAEHNPRVLPAPILDYNRPRIDMTNAHLYARPVLASVVDMYLSAHDYMRFGGPRLSPPYRDLHNLIFLDPTDASDWAENIRWAKEQYIAFGNVWSEEQSSLNVITVHRMRIGWQSKEAKAFMAESERQVRVCMRR